MTAHAIIVGIDHYANTAWNLGSAVRDALRFRAWATAAAGVAEPRLLLSPRDDQPPGVPFERAEYQAIQDAFDAFAAQPTRDGDQLYVYLACHGISAPGLADGGGPVIVPCDVADLVRHRKKLYSLDEMIDGLASHGPRDQYFFVDACRSFVIDSMVAPPLTGNWRPKGGAAPCRQYALYATSAGGKAYGEFTGGIFSDALLDALDARGPRLGSDDSGNFVLEWSELTEHVIGDVRGRIARAAARDQLQEPQTYSRVGGRSVLRTLAPAQLATRQLSVSIQPPAARKACRVSLARQLPGALLPVASCDPELPLPIEWSKLLPGPYVVIVAGDDYTAPSKQVPLWSLEAYLDITMDDAGQRGLESIDGGRGLESLGAPPLGTLVVDAGRNADLPVHIRDGFGELVASGRNTLTADLDPGSYRVEIIAPDGTRDLRLAEVRSDDTTFVDYAPRPLALGAATQALLAQHGLGADPRNYREPSELLGKMPDQTLASLLGLAALAQALPDDGNLQKLRSLGVALPAVSQGRAAITVIVAATDFRPTDNWLADLAIGAWSDAGLAPLAPRPLTRFPVAVQAVADVAPGVHAIRIAIRGQSIAHHAVCALPDRLSVLVVVPGDSLDVQQYILPRPGEPGTNREHIGACVRAERAQRRFATNQIEELTEPEVADLVHGKWVDPLFGAIGGYALLRRGEIEKWREANHNMLANFAELPDTHVLAGLADPERRDTHFAAAIARGVPVIADGVRALATWHTERGAALPAMLAEAHRDLVAGAAWTSWVSPRPRVAITETGLGAIPPGWHDLVDIEASLAALLKRIDEALIGNSWGLRNVSWGLRNVALTNLAEHPASSGAPRIGQRVAALSPDERIVAPGILLRIDGDHLAHDCAPIASGYLIEITGCTVIGVIDHDAPAGSARRFSGNDSLGDDGGT